MAHPQTGILALGTLSHAYPEFDRRDGVDAARETPLMCISGRLRVRAS